MSTPTVLNQTLRQGKLRRSILAPELERPTMKRKTFKGTRKLVDIIANAKAQDVAVDDYNYRVNGSDNIAFGVSHGERPDGTPMISCGSIGAWVLYNAASGRFFGRTDKGVEFSSDDARHEREHWFQALLGFFYVEEAETETLDLHVATMTDYKVAKTQVLRDKSGKRVGSIKVVKIKGGMHVKLTAAKGLNLRDMLPQMLEPRKPAKRAPLSASPPPRDSHRPGGLYQVDSSDGGAY